jgi:hypothetical protein
MYESCSGPDGKGRPARPGFLVPAELPGAVVIKAVSGHTWFSVNGRTGPDFRNNEGFFKFEVLIGKRKP